MKSMMGLMALLSCGLVGVSGETNLPVNDEPVKTSVVEQSASVPAQGEVVAISAEGMVLKDRISNKLLSLPLHPAQAEGKLLSHVYDGEAYLWSDILVGDTVSSHWWKDDAEGKIYWVDFQINRRPNGRVPPSQLARAGNPGRTPAYHEWANVYNDLKAGNKLPDDLLRYTGFLPPLETQPIPNRIPPAKK